MGKFYKAYELFYNVNQYLGILILEKAIYETRNPNVNPMCFCHRFL